MRIPCLKASSRHGGTKGFSPNYFVIFFRQSLIATPGHFPKSTKSLSVVRKIPKGVKGAFPLGCLPLWSRERVTLASVAEWIGLFRKIFQTQSRSVAKFFLQDPVKFSCQNQPGFFNRTQVEK